MSIPAESVRVLPPSVPPRGVLAVPGSKSLANRALLLAGVARGTSRLRGVPESADALAAQAALTALGVPCRKEGDELVVAGVGLTFPNWKTDLNIGSAGTVGRFLPGLLAAAPEGEWRLVATPQLAARPIAPLLDALAQWGARLSRAEPDRSFPLLVRGGGLSGGELNVSAAASSQFASGALMTAPLCRRPAAVLIRDLDPEEIYIDMTLALLRRFGVESRVSRDGGDLRVEVDAPREYRAASFAIDADANTASYFLALAALTQGDVTIANLNPASGQPGLKFLDVLARMGCDIRRDAAAGSVAARGLGLPLRGGFSIDMRSMSESALTLGVLAVFADGPVTMTNLAHIRGHETDRLAALAALLRQVGCRVEEFPDGATVWPTEPGKLIDAVIDPLDDHRLAMSFALLGAAGKGLTILNPRCVDKTCPTFFHLLGELLPVRTENMRIPGT